MQSFKKADVLNFVSKLSFQKLLNAFLIWISFQLSSIIKRPVVWGLPFNISVEPTTHCNLRCPECPSGLRSFTRPTGSLDFESFRSFIPQIKERLIYLYFYFQGEPYLNTDFLKMVHLAADNNIYTVTSTNAHYLDEEMARKTVESGLDRIIISIDGTEQETYESYRIGGKLDKVLTGTKELVKWKKHLQSVTPHIIFQFLVVGSNEHQIPELYQLADRIGVDEVKLKTAQINNFEKGNPLIPEREEYSRYKKEDNGSYSIKNPLNNHCWKLWHSCVITWDGNIVPCCFDKDAKYNMGNTGNMKFAEIWKSSGYDNFRKSILKSRKEIDICKNCTEGLKVWA
ncbi:MAG: radical SAM/SPASM domain-containing protein [Chitinophagales bacterium]